MQNDQMHASPYLYLLRLQACENALRDWNKVFGEGHMVKGEAEDWNTESPLRTCTKSDWFRSDGSWGYDSDS